MTNSLTDYMKEFASLYVLELLTDKEKSKFEKNLIHNEALQLYVHSLKMTLNITSLTKMPISQEFELQSQRNLLRANIDGLEIKKTKIDLGFWKQIKELINIPTPIWINITSVAVAFGLGLYLMKTIQHPAQNNPEIDIIELLKIGQLGQINFADKGFNDDRIRFAVESKQDFELSGTVNDELISNLLFYLLLHDQNPGKRLKAVKLLQNTQPDHETKMVLVSALLTDSNPGVRLKSIRMLSTYAPEEIIQNVCMKVLLEDKNEAVRLSAMGIIELAPNESMIPALQVVSILDKNDFIRNRAQELLRTFLHDNTDFRVEAKS
ncbi:MAG: HEAT repeat domain-containing protein [Candidatus Marinimicrobia bacterium]|jgi:hypothetical protein|nr:HEAT repeat domain-containing protein [Candidatus Neomarinimicrobiota bacterium]MBT3501220.1 HEAT repeat domain-containing protein [Candidatus Neomarinimicrobiota bacterium]MBT3839501.1 HEAT repeat domain-containing protein [Candidatus Neomarinimicrobiota bacterium]MBT3999402.1 HEAT repeat domain-containing protein [Candidatus Neomarinimicrobiota bacterium]MBT4282514.1 HEAT repeat domain-containing protein [Candidatus Neomarinimicrobiota bacterium]